jgi:hypothetical protein
MKKSIVLHKNTFKTKKASYEFLKKKIYDLGECVIDVDHAEFEFFKSISSFKLEKLNAVIDAFILFRKIGMGRSIHMKVRFRDRVDKSISWRECSAQKSIITSYALKLDSSLRMAIRPDTRIFYQNNEDRRCVYCSEVCNIQVDHINPFSEIKSAFLKENNSKHLKFKQKDGVYYFHDDEDLYEGLWVRYHRMNATYQYLCRSCNIRKSNKSK